MKGRMVEKGDTGGRGGERGGKYEKRRWFKRWKRGGESMIERRDV